MNIIGYKQVDYKQLQQEMQKRYADYREGKSEIDLAVAINIKSTQTVRNAFRQDYQMVSDELLTSLNKAIGLNTCVVWENGVRNYFIPKK